MIFVSSESFSHNTAQAELSWIFKIFLWIVLGGHLQEAMAQVEKEEKGVPVVAQWLTNPTRNH